MDKRIHIILLSYYWPPAGGPGVQRWTKFIKYLSEQNCDITVITPDPEKASFPVIDKTLLPEIENVTVVHTSTSEPFGAYKKLSGSKDVPIGGFSNQGKASVIKKLMMAVRGNFFIPDARKGWVPYATKAAQKVIDKRGADVIISTGPPHSTHLAAYDIKLKNNIKWIADFRDPWSKIYYNKDLFRTPLAERYDRFLEARVLKTADLLITVTPGFKKSFTDLHPEINQRPFEVIYNGFDAADLGQPQPIKDDMLRIAFTGTISERYDYRAFTDGLALFAENNPDTNWEFRVAGVVPPYMHEKLAPFEGKFIFEGYVPHTRSLQILKEANVLYYALGLGEEFVGQVGGKVFEYAGSGRKILHALPENFDANVILKELGTGISPQANTKEAWAALLQDLNQNKEKLRYTEFPAVKLEAYTRKSLSNKLWDAIVKLVK